MAFPHGLWRTRGGFILDRAMFVLGGPAAVLLTLHPKPHHPVNPGGGCWAWEWWSVKFTWGHIRTGLQWSKLITSKLIISGQPDTGNVFHELSHLSVVLSAFINSSPMLNKSDTLPCSGSNRWGMRMDRGEGELGEKICGREDRWRQTVWGKRKYGRREQKGMRQKERQRARAQQGERTGQSVTRLRPHLFSASLHIWTISQQREQGKINKNSPVGTTAHRPLASLTDKSSQPPISVKQLFSHFLLPLCSIYL